MSTVPAFPVFLQDAQAGAHATRPHTAAMDWFVLINLAFLMFMLGFFACWAWLLWRRSTRPEPHVRLLMELEEEGLLEDQRPRRAEQAEASRADWEREPDWWRK